MGILLLWQLHRRNPEPRTELPPRKTILHIPNWELQREYQGTNYGKVDHIIRGTLGVGRELIQTGFPW